MLKRIDRLSRIHPQAPAPDPDPDPDTDTEYDRGMDTDAIGSFETEPLLPEVLPAEPFGLFLEWFEQAQHAGEVPNPNAMTLATVDPDGKPSARIVLCKAVEPARGAIVWYSNYRSRKGLALEANPRAAAVFHWDKAERQVRVEGVVFKTSTQESDAYFASRAWESRVGAWASHQSQPIESRQALMEQVAQTIIDQNIDIAAAVRGDPVEIPRPPFWGGYRLVVLRIELWAGSTGRIHDRAVWEREYRAADADISSGVNPSMVSPWKATRLAP